MIATLAPKTAALEMPKVEGDAIGLSRQLCLINPETDNPIPAMMPARIRGRRIFCLIRILTLSPFPKSAKKESEKERLDGPAKREKKPITNKRKPKTDKRILFFRFSFILI